MTSTSSANYGSADQNESVRESTNNDNASSFVAEDELAQIHSGRKADNYITEVDRRCCRVGLNAAFVWMGLAICSYCFAYMNDNIEKLTGVEQKAPMAAAMLLGMSLMSTILPLAYRWKIDGNKTISGVIVAGLVVQTIALITDLALCTMPVPVMTDPFTGARVFLLRWSEWTPLAYVMTFLTESCKVDEGELEKVASKAHPLLGVIDAVAAHGGGLVGEVDGNSNGGDDSDESSELELDCHDRVPLNSGSQARKRRSKQNQQTQNANKDNLSHNATEDMPSYTCVKNSINLDSAHTVALSQGLSTFCGWLFPYITNKVLWLLTLSVSCCLFLVIYYRLYRRKISFKNMKLGSSISEKEMFLWAKLSLGLLTTCVCLWTCLVCAFFVYSIGPMLLPNDTFLRTRGIVMVCECVIDVVFKSVYMLLIIDVHSAIFDPNARAHRRLEEMRQMMSVVWDNSSDVIGLSIQRASGDVITVLSPTFLKLYSDNGCDDHIDSAHDLDRFGITEPCSSSGIAFELDAKYFRDDVSHDQKIIPTDVYNVEFNLHKISPGSIEDNDKIPGVSRSNVPKEELVSISELVTKAWNMKSEATMILHDMVQVNNGRQETIRCEANITQLEENALVIVVRNISERFRRFEAEKKAVSETTARIKDAAANRFTRHEVKNGLLAAIGLCDSLKETRIQGMHDQDESGKRILFELDKTLHEILDTILAEAMARDVIHEDYEPKHERVDVVQLIESTMNSTATAASMERFPIVTEPSPLPDMALDPQLLKYIHRNAVSNACKYGRRGGAILTEIKWDSKKGILQMDVINLPGSKHEEILKLGDLASEIIFSPATRLPMHSLSHEGSASHSSGDGAWVMHKCAKTLGGDCVIKFVEDKTIFTFRCPVTPFGEGIRSSFVVQKKFKLPPNIYAIALDDSKIQRKLLARYFTYAGIPVDRVVILGGSAQEIKTFDDWAVSFIVEHPDDYFLFIIDENLDVHDDQTATREGTISGSSSISKVRRRLLSDQERRILALIRSANDSANDVAIYNSRAHGYLPKAPIKPGKVLEELAPLWLSRFPPLEGDLKRVTSRLNISDADDELAASIRDLIENITSINNMVKDDYEETSKDWRTIWEKLHVLKGDLLTLTEEDDGNLSTMTKMINGVRGDTMPPDFVEKWRAVHSKLINPS